MQFDFINHIVTQVIKRIGTHDGKFHADEAFACALLQMTREFSRSGTGSHLSTWTLTGSL